MHLAITNSPRAGLHTTTRTCTRTGAAPARRARPTGSALQLSLTGLDQHCLLSHANGDHEIWQMLEAVQDRHEVRDNHRWKMDMLQQ